MAGIPRFNKTRWLLRGRTSKSILGKRKPLRVAYTEAVGKCQGALKERRENILELISDATTIGMLQISVDHIAPVTTTQTVLQAGSGTGLTDVQALDDLVKVMSDLQKEPGLLESRYF